LLIKPVLSDAWTWLISPLWAPTTMRYHIMRPFVQHSKLWG
jgi:hypothetical protein